MSESLGLGTMLISGDRLLSRPAGAIDELEEQNTNMLAQTTARGLTKESIRHLAVRSTKGFRAEVWTHIAALRATSVATHCSAL